MARVSVSARRVVFAMALVLAPTLARAQASIAGVVKDVSGAVIPGVTVEAASPVLIEKTRTVVTDSSGQYKIEQLRPGAYSVTFTLTGFTTIKRDGVEAAGTLATTVNAELRVGTVNETVVVTGAAPTVDVHGIRQERVLGQELLEALPLGELRRRPHC